MEDYNALQRKETEDLVKGAKKVHDEGDKLSDGSQEDIMSYNSSENLSLDLTDEDEDIAQ